MSTPATSVICPYVPVVLGEIRIASLLPSSAISKPLTVELHTSLLDENPIYDALSYVWGTEISKEQLRLSVFDSTKVRNRRHDDSVQPPKVHSFSNLPITRNLDIALRSLRLRDRPRLLWIDAICIDQKNVSERDTQVQQMRRIYSQASKVVVWLGEETPSTQVAFNVFNSLEQDAKSDRSLEELPKATASAIDEVFARPWWSRRWVLQEVALAKDDPVVVCGSQVTKFENFVSFVSCYGYVFDWNMLIGFRLQSRTESRWQTRTQLRNVQKRVPRWTDRDLFEIYKSDGMQEATDPKDHVYAVLGLTTKHYRDNIPVNYKRTVSQVYQQATMAAISRNGNLDVLIDLKKAPDKSVLDLPSWTKDFSLYSRDPLQNKTPNSVARILEWGLQHDKNVFRNHLSFIKHDIDSGTLSVDGIMLGQIRTVLRTTSTKQDLLFRRKTSQLADSVSTFYARLGVTDAQLSKLLRDLNDTTSDTSCGEQVSTSSSSYTQADLCRTMISGNSAFGMESTQFDFQFIAKGLTSAYRDADADSLKSLLESEQTMLLKYLADAVLCACWGSAYFCTSPAEQLNCRTLPPLLGLSSREIAEGDIVVVVFGTSLPVVLRPLSIDSINDPNSQARPSNISAEKYQFISFAYVDGAMSGGLAKDIEKVLKQARSFDFI